MISVQVYIFCLFYVALPSGLSYVWSTAVKNVKLEIPEANIS